jgi:hypothetical protein
MKINQIGIIAALTLAMITITSGKSQATGLVLQNAELATPPSGAFVLGECSNAGLCKPGDLLNLTYDPGSASVYAKNDSTFDFTKFVYTILPNQDATWDPASTFNFFKTNSISTDGKVLTLSNGVFASGTTALFSAATTGNTPIKAAITFEGTPAIKSVPEPGNSAALAVLGLGGLLVKKKKFAQKAA